MNKYEFITIISNPSNPQKSLRSSEPIVNASVPFWIKLSKYVQPVNRVHWWCSATSQLILFVFAEN